MLASLSVGEIGAIVLMDGETEAAFKTANVIFEKVGVLVEIDVLKGEFSQALAAVGIGRGMGGDASAAELGSYSILKYAVKYQQVL